MLLLFKLLQESFLTNKNNKLNKSLMMKKESKKENLKEEHMEKMINMINMKSRIIRNIEQENQGKHLKTQDKMRFLFQIIKLFLKINLNLILQIKKINPKAPERFMKILLFNLKIKKVLYPREIHSYLIIKEETKSFVKVKILNK